MSHSLVIGSLHALHAIGLTGREPEAMLAVGSHLQQTAQAHDIPLQVFSGVCNPEEAAVVVGAGGELWRVGFDPGRPELDAFIDRQLDTTSLQTLQAQADHCLGLFLANHPVSVPSSLNSKESA